MSVGAAAENRARQIGNQRSQKPLALARARFDASSSEFGFSLFCVRHFRYYRPADKISHQSNY
ncbi:MAG: hypothetical protein M3525_08870 [Acidobacteriota bacterium]|nr:hypothetical protein [Acidobacteriota bacterium]